MRFIKFNLRLFDGEVINKSTSNEPGNDLSPAMKTYYSDYLIDMAEPKLVHDRFGQKRPIPKNSGKSVEFRKYDSLPKATKPLDEGITPKGNKMNMSTVSVEVNQYGDYIAVTDILELTAIDKALVEATKILGSQAGRTLDTVVREVLNGGTNVLFANGKTARGQLSGGSSTAANNDILRVRDVRLAGRALKVQNAEAVEGKYYMAIIHPDCKFDLMDDPDWKFPHQYKDTKEIYDDEIGEIAGIRFVETTEAKIFTKGEPFAEGMDTLTVTGYSSGTITVSDNITSTIAASLEDRRILLASGEEAVIASATAKDGSTAATITLEDTPQTAPVATDVIYPAGGGKEGRNVYSTLVIGDNAYGTTEIQGGGLQHIFKPLGSGGTSDPLNQRATAGWKATLAAARLIEQYMIRIESVTSFNDLDAN